jgi:hypothetical protein
MSVAKQVLNVETTNLDWLEIEDEEGKVYRYLKGKTVPDGSPVHVTWDLNGIAMRAKVARGTDGKVLLRQDDPGLPQQINVYYTTPLQFTPGTATRSGWQSILEYNQT